MSVRFFNFGALDDGREVTAAQITGERGMSVTVLDFGATVQSLKVPDKSGALVDVVLGYDSAREYECSDGYLGATVGRVCNRIGGAKFNLNGATYTLAANDKENHLHGGIKGFDKHFWNMREQDGALVCRRLSPDGEEGYPGSVEASVTFRLSANFLSIRYEAVSDRDTPLCLTNHSYFNLSGEQSVLSHRLFVNADRFCEADKNCLPTGALLPVDGTALDFRGGKEIGRDISKAEYCLDAFGGYDHCFALNGGRAAVLYSPESGIEMAVDTDLCGMQVYTANFLTKRRGKAGRDMQKHGAVCLETQFFPNAVNLPQFSSPLLKAGERYRSETVFTFSAK